MRRLFKALLPASFFYFYRAYRAYWFGEREIEILKDLVSADRAAIDIGANYGEYAFWLERLSCRVFLFEPFPQCVDFLRECVADNTEVFQVGLSNVSGESVLQVPVDEKSSAVAARASLSNKAVSEFSCVDEIFVHLSRLDEFNIDNVGYIKIDVEGHEREVLEGALDTIRRCRPNLQIEIEQRHLDCDIADMFEYIASLGYDSFFYRQGKLVSLQEFDLQRDQIDVLASGAEPEKLLRGGYVNNFIFIPN